MPLDTLDTLDREDRVFKQLSSVITRMRTSASPELRMVAELLDLLFDELYVCRIDILIELSRKVK